METMIRDDVSGKEASHEVSETATAGELLQEACRLFGREELDSALEVDGAVVCTGVVGGVSGGEASVGSLGVHSDSSLVLCRSRDRVLAKVAWWDNGNRVFFHKDSLPVWAWDDEVVALAAVAVVARTVEFVRAAATRSCLTPWNGGTEWSRSQVRKRGTSIRQGARVGCCDEQRLLPAVCERQPQSRQGSCDHCCCKPLLVVAVRE